MKRVRSGVQRYNDFMNGTESYESLIAEDAKTVINNKMGSDKNRVFLKGVLESYVKYGHMTDKQKAAVEYTLVKIEFYHDHRPTA